MLNAREPKWFFSIYFISLFINVPYWPFGSSPNLTLIKKVSVDLSKLFLKNVDKENSSNFFVINLLFLLVLLGLWTTQIFCQGGKNLLFTQINLQKLFSYAFMVLFVLLSEFILFFVSLLQIKLLLFGGNLSDFKCLCLVLFSGSDFYVFLLICF